MKLKPMKTLKSIEKYLGEETISVEGLSKAYDSTLRLRSQLISVMGQNCARVIYARHSFVPAFAESGLIKYSVENLTQIVHIGQLNLRISL